MASKVVKGAAVGGAIAVGAALSPLVVNLSTLMFDHWEGRNYTVVQNSFDPRGVYTVCGGITNYDIPTLKIGQRFNEAECQKMIASAIPRYGAPLIKCVKNFSEQPPHRQASQISFAINLGAARICKTSIAKDLNAGRTAKACNKMREYVSAKGRRLKALVDRRNDPVWGEAPWCLRED